MAPFPTSASSLEARREEVIGALGVAFASDDLSMAAFERRLVIAVRAAFMGARGAVKLPREKRLRAFRRVLEELRR